MLPRKYEDAVGDEAHFVIDLCELHLNDAQTALDEADDRQLHALQILAEDILAFRTVLSSQQKRILAKDADAVRKIVRARTVESLRKIVVNVGISLIRKIAAPALPEVKEILESERGSAPEEKPNDSVADDYEEQPPTERSTSNENPVDANDAA